MEGFGCQSSHLTLRVSVTERMPDAASRALHYHTAEQLTPTASGPITQRFKSPISKQYWLQ
jgi:hypothetical protein